MHHGPLRSTTCSTRTTRSTPLPFLPSFARTPACLPTDLRHSRLLSSSHRSPVLHSLDSLLLPFLLSLAPMRSCPPTVLTTQRRHRYSRPQRFPPGYVTKRSGSEMKSTTLKHSILLSRSSPGYFLFSALESRNRSPLRGCVRRPMVLTTQRRRRYSRSQRLPPRSRRALLA